MPDDVTLPTEQGTETATVSEAPTDFREYTAWRKTGELPEPKEPETPAAADDKPPAKTEPDSETDDSQDAGEDDEQEDAAPAKPGKGGSRARRIDRLTRENEELRRLLAQPAKPQDKPSEPAQAAAPGKPKLEDFTTLESYQEALTDWKLDQREQTRKEAEKRTAAEETVRKEQDSWAKREKAARKAHDDYDDLIDTVKIPAGPGVLAARQAMLEDDNGAELLYYLAKNPKELERIAGLAPASAAVAIGKLSAKFDHPPAPEPPGKPRITGAPKPPPPSGRAGKTASDDPNDPEVQKDFPRWAKAREAQIKGR
jgi:hypothetical protein